MTVANIHNFYTHAYSNSPLLIGKQGFCYLYIVILIIDVGVF